MASTPFYIVDVFAEQKYAGTGSANSGFAAYLAKHRYVGTDRIDVRVEQGYEIGRPSLIYLKAQDRGGTIHVEVGGEVIPIAQGRLL
ncbi:MAG: PhzF family phenazine biosynthesis protein [Planctomycetes bacterium]|nr:PhzF family phenazine biosynthesis protein [Planctomycetota bacterium]